ncbi:MAG TPA: glycosyltransferase [Bryobacteraceae bacterium]|nr:glycosyltransferase [Bryobacteraceae bacterium]
MLLSPLHWLPDPPFTAQDFAGSHCPKTGDIVFIQKLCGPYTIALMKSLRHAGVHTVYVDCDAPLKLNEAALASRVVCASSSLAGEYTRVGIPAVFIPDAYEISAPPRGGALSPNRKLRGVWFGWAGAGRWTQIQDLRAVIDSSLPNWELLVVSNHPDADVAWDLETVWDHLRGCDAAVLPGENQSAQLKSANRVVQAMALGLPVAAQDTTAYAEVIRHDRNGLLCRSPSDWRAALEHLSVPYHRERLALAGHRYARRWFSLSRVGRLWEELLLSLGASRTIPEDEGRAAFLHRARASVCQRIAQRLPVSDLQRCYWRLASRESERA